MGNDGGVDISVSGGETWYAPPLPISQFYRIGVDTRNPYHISGTMQDLGSIAGPSNSLSARESRSRTGTTWAAARRATAFPIRPTRMSSTPVNTQA